MKSGVVLVSEIRNPNLERPVYLLTHKTQRLYVGLQMTNAGVHGSMGGGRPEEAELCLCF